MLLQLLKHKRNALSKTELIAQCDPNQIKFLKKSTKDNIVEQWIEDVQSRHKLADDEIWLLCDDTSPFFKIGTVRP